MIDSSAKGLIKPWSHRIDEAVALGAENAAQVFAGWPGYEWKAALTELYKLSNDQDAFYDRPTIGVHYAFWYHARRVNTLVGEVIKTVNKERPDNPQEIVFIDLGAGTGALSWACGLVALAAKEKNQKIPRLKVVEVENSPFMLQTGNALWKAFNNEFGVEESDMVRESEVISWTEAEFTDPSPVSVFASYVFDHTDGDIYRIKELKAALSRVVARCNAQEVVMVASNKKALAAKKVLATVGKVEESSSDEMWVGPMAKTKSARRRVFSQQGLSDNGAPMFSEPWGQRVLRVQVSIMNQGKLLEEDRWWNFNEEQLTAVDLPLDVPLLIRGAAGSGKSVTLVERLARQVTSGQQTGLQKILVTSFNKDLIDQLAKWTEERLEFSGAHYERLLNNGGGAKRIGGIGPLKNEIHFMNWDKAPFRLFRVPPMSLDPSRWLAAVTASIEELKINRGFQGVNIENLDAQFIDAEFRRVIYGLLEEPNGFDEYKSVERKGRGARLGHVQREFVWQALKAATTRERTFTHAKIEMKRRVGTPRRKFTSVFIDEAQDFTPADLKCANALLKEGLESVTWVVDEAQAVHLGSSYVRPDSPGRKRVPRVSLKGSYRLPVTISRCVKPLAEAVSAVREGHQSSGEDVCIPESRKASVAGARPILIVGNVKSLARQIVEIEQAYRPFVASQGGEDSVTIIEMDYDLQKLVNAEGVRCDTTTIKKIKGLERGIVVWSARQGLGDAPEPLETAYTILTRSTSVVVIAVDEDQIPDEGLEAIRALDAEYLMQWDQNAEDWFEENV